MTTVIVQSGSCGYSVTIAAEKGPDKKISISVETECEMVKKMEGDLQGMDRLTALTGFHHNPVYASAARHLKHVACPVPSAILKAIEVEAGMNVAKDATIVFPKKK
jgi:hypothetical protein